MITNEDINTRRGIANSHAISKGYEIHKSYIGKGCEARIINTKTRIIEYVLQGIEEYKLAKATSKFLLCI